MPRCRRRETRKATFRDRVPRCACDRRSSASSRVPPPGDTPCGYRQERRPLLPCVYVSSVFVVMRWECTFVALIQRAAKGVLCLLERLQIRDDGGNLLIREAGFHGRAENGIVLVRSQGRHEHARLHLARVLDPERKVA